MKNAQYALRPIPEGYTCIKCDEDLNYSTSYLLIRRHDGWVCTCRQTRDCRHSKMIPLFQKKFGKGWWFCYDQGTWSRVRMR